MGPRPARTALLLLAAASALTAGARAEPSAPNSTAESAPATPQHATRIFPPRLLPLALTLELGYAHMALAQRADAKFGLSGSSGALLVSVGAVFREILAVSVDFGTGKGISSFDDARPLMATTSPTYGGSPTGTNSGNFLAANLGLRTPRMFNLLSLGVDVGTVALSIQREYPDCGGCGGEPVDTHGGTFYSLRAALGWGPDEAHSSDSVLRLCGVGLSYRRPFLASDLTDIWTLAVGCY